MWFFVVFVGFLLLAIAVLVYFNEGGPATIEIFTMIGLFTLFMYLGLWPLSAIVVIVWLCRKYLTAKRNR